MKAFKARIYGRVQGVFFRATTAELATKLGLDGYVRNCNDGSVEVFAQGDEEKLHELIKFLHKGPELAKVEKVELVWTRPEEGLCGFAILY